MHETVQNFKTTLYNIDLRMGQAGEYIKEFLQPKKLEPQKGSSCSVGRLIRSSRNPQLR